MALNVFYVQNTGRSHFCELLFSLTKYCLIARVPLQGDNVCTDGHIISTTEQRIQDDTRVDSQLDDYLKITKGTMPVVYRDTSESAAMSRHRDVACCTEISDPNSRIALPVAVVFDARSAPTGLPFLPVAIPCAITFIPWTIRDLFLIRSVRWGGSSSASACFIILQLAKAFPVSTPPHTFRNHDEALHVLRARCYLSYNNQRFLSSSSTAAWSSWSSSPWSWSFYERQLGCR